MESLASMIGYVKHSGEWYDGGYFDRFHMDEMPMWETISPKSRKKGVSHALDFVEKFTER